MISRCGCGLPSTVLLAQGAFVPAVVDETQAVSANEPALRSACVIACVPVQVTNAVGANVAGIAGLQLKLTNAGVSVTDTPFNVTFPSFFASIVYVITSPTAA